MSAAALKGALAALVEAAVSAGLPAQDAAAEGRIVSAAVAEANRGAYLDWCAALDLPASAQTFMDAAVRGRRYRASTTPLAAQTLSSAGNSYSAALAAVCEASANLGEPTPEAHRVAATAAAAQRGTLPATPTPTNPASAGPISANPTQPDAADAAAQAEFLRRAPAILNDVLGQLSANRSALLDLSQLDPQAPGAFAGLGRTPATDFPMPNLTAAGVPAPPSASAATPEPALDPSAAPAASAHQAGAEPTPPTETEPEPEKSVEEWLAELDQLVGLDTVKSELHRQTAILKVDALRTKAGLRSPTITRHLVFVGNPGTGKTTVARMVAGIYKAIGLLSTGQLIEVDRSELVAGYVGQTAIKTAEVAAKAYGGVLFIDEAYSLNGDAYGEEAINTLVKEMEDHRDDLVVIVAGYPAPMDEFIANNPGLASRFRTTIEFENYSDDELRKILSSMAAASDFDLGPGCLEVFGTELARQVRDENFGNGRFARNLLEAAIGRHAWRLRDLADPSIEELRTLLPSDLIEPTSALVPPQGAAPIEAVEFNESPVEQALTQGTDSAEAGPDATSPHNPSETES